MTLDQAEQGLMDMLAGDVHGTLIGEVLLGFRRQYANRPWDWRRNVDRYLDNLADTVGLTYSERLCLHKFVANPSVH